MKEIARYSGCFVCGSDNEIGLRAQFFWDETRQRAVCDITAEEIYAGYKDIYHGGIISALLDEIMIKSLLALDLHVVTAEMTVRYKKPVYIGDKIRFEGWMTRDKGSIFLTEGAATNQDGEMVASAFGKYIKPRGELSDRLRASIE